MNFGFPPPARGSEKNSVKGKNTTSSGLPSPRTLDIVPHTPEDMKKIGALRTLLAHRLRHP
jgi:hypothetical protein